MNFWNYDYTSDSRYTQLLPKVRNIKSYLGNAINALEGIDINLANACIIDKSAVEKLKVDDIVQSLKNRKTKLSNTIIPSIEDEIDG